MTDKWQHESFESVRKAVAENNRQHPDLRFRINQVLFMLVNSLPCPAPADDPDGNYRVVREKEVQIIQRQDQRGNWVPVATPGG